MRPIDILLFLLIIGLLIYYIVDTRKNIERIEQKMDDALLKTIKTDNHCDVCCRECQDNDVCVGACVHCKNQGENKNG